jgi:hypothetical protein
VSRAGKLAERAERLIEKDVAVGQTTRLQQAQAGS